MLLIWANPSEAGLKFMRHISNIMQLHSRILCGLILTFGCLLHSVAGYSFFELTGHSYGSDDAYISYRYAENLMHGHGLVYNPGERVEGYSNLLYILLVAPAFLFTGGIGVYVYSVIVNIICALGAYWVFLKWICKKFPPHITTSACFLFAMSPLIWLWTASGLETILMLLVQLVIWAKVERCAEPNSNSNDLFILNLAIVFSVLVRADGFITPIFALLYLLLKGKYKKFWGISGVFLFTVILLFIWRYSYYGFWFPNTYYAKISGPLFLRIKSAFLMLLAITKSEGLFIYFAGVTYFWIIQMWKAYKHQLSYEGILSFDKILFVGILSYWIYIGGDNFFERFLLILYPLGIFIIFQNIGQSIPKNAFIVLMGILTIFQLGVFVVDSRFQYTFQKYDRLIALGNYLASQHAGQVLAIDAAGKAPFFSGLNTIDMFGLNDLHIAHQHVSKFVVGHNTFDPVYVLSKNPDLIAGWIVSNKLNLNAGMTSRLYMKAGYKIKYLVRTNPTNTGSIIVDVSGLDTTSIIDIVNNGYSYAVLQKTR
jgi:arabinofuranosyltransferase